MCKILFVECIKNFPALIVSIKFYIERLITFTPILICFLAWSCKGPTGPEGEEFPIYVNTLNQGFDIGVESSEQQRNWLYDMHGYMKMAYPSYQEYGFVFIVTGAVALENVSEDFSDYKQLAVELKGERGGEYVAINIEDINYSPTNSQFVLNLSSEWQTYFFPLSAFGEEVNLRKLHTVLKFLFSGNKASTVYFRNVRYLKTPSIEDTPFYLLTHNYIATGYDLGIVFDSTTTDTISVKIDTENNFLKVKYPRGKSWGSVFIYRKDNIPQDFSSYNKILFQLKGEKGQEVVNIGIRDTSNFANDVKFSLRDTSWHPYDIPLYLFQFTNLKQIISATTFTFYGQKEQTIYVRDIYLIKED